MAHSTGEPHFQGVVRRPARRAAARAEGWLRRGGRERPIGAAPPGGGPNPTRQLCIDRAPDRRSSPFGSSPSSLHAALTWSAPFSRVAAPAARAEVRRRERPIEAVPPARCLNPDEQRGEQEGVGRAVADCWLSPVGELLQPRSRVVCRVLDQGGATPPLPVVGTCPWHLTPGLHCRRRGSDAAPPAAGRRWRMHCADARCSESNAELSLRMLRFGI